MAKKRAKKNENENENGNGGENEDEGENKPLKPVACTPCTPPRLHAEGVWEVPETPPEERECGFEAEDGDAEQQQNQKGCTRKRLASPEY